jgi:hypothetical protein
MMAGPTALRMKPRARASIQGMPKTAWATEPEMRASAMPGMRRRREAAGPARRKVRQSSSSPDRKKIRASAPWRILARQGVGRARTSQGTGIFWRAMPASSWPSRGWRPRKEIRAPPV